MARPRTSRAGSGLNRRCGEGVLEDASGNAGDTGLLLLATAASREPFAAIHMPADAQDTVGSVSDGRQGKPWATARRK